MLPFALSSTLLLVGWIFLMTVWTPGVWLKDVDFSFEKIRQDVINDENMQFIALMKGLQLVLESQSVVRQKCCQACYRLSEYVSAIRPPMFNC